MSNSLGNKQVMADNIKYYMEKKHVSSVDMCRVLNVPQSTFSYWINAKTYPRIDKIEKMADYFGISKADLVEPRLQFSYKNLVSAAIDAMPDSVTESVSNLSKAMISILGEKGIFPVPAMRSVPLVGTIACGTPILAEQNIEGDVSAPEHVHADFALRCQGDSMINARIFDGDIVYIRQQETVDDGEIAAVLINDEATLKRVHLYEDHVVLEPENPQYRPLVYWGIDMNAVRILGKAVAFTSIVR